MIKILKIAYAITMIAGISTILNMVILRWSPEGSIDAIGILTQYQGIWFILIPALYCLACAIAILIVAVLFGWFNRDHLKGIAAIFSYLLALQTTYSIQVSLVNTFFSAAHGVVG